MLREMIITVKALDDGFLPFHNASYIHGLFFKMINQDDSEFSTKLHNKNDIKPFTISNLHSLKTTDKNYIINKGKTYKIRVTFIDNLTFSIFVSAMLKYQTDEIGVSIGSINFNISGFELTNTLSVNDIVEGDIKHRRSFEMKFLSPTAFRRKGINHLLPEPYSIFNSYSSKWNKLLDCDKKISHEEIMKMESSIYITRYRLKTQIVEMDKYKIVGFKGTCSYEIKKDIDDNTLRNINYLLKFAPYCGTGYKSTMGMGQVIVI